MCEIFIGADPKLWESSTRSLRIDGMVTSVRLENMFWSTLEEIGRRDDMSVTELIHQLYHESIDAEHDLGNFTSFLRVCCLRYMNLQLAKLIPERTDIPIRILPAADILREENSRRDHRQSLDGEL